MIAKEHGDIDLQFERSEFNLFPISTKLINVKIKKNEYKLNAASISMVFGIRDLFAKNFSVGKIILNESIINVPAVEKMKTQEKFNLEKYFEQYNKLVFEKSPIRVRGVELHNTKVLYDNKSSMVYAMQINFYKNIITGKINASTDNDVIDEFIGKGIKLPKIDGVYASIQVTKEHIRMQNLKIFSETSYLSATAKIHNGGNISDGHIKGFLELEKMKQVIPKDIVSQKLLPSGGVEFSLSFDKADRNKPTFKGSFHGKKIYSEYYRADEIRGQVNSDGQKLYISNIAGTIKTGKFNVGERFAVFDWSKSKTIYPKVKLKLKNIYSNNVLFFLNGLDGLKFFTDGDIELEFLEEHLSITARKDVAISKFKLLTNISGEVVVQNELVKLKDQGTIDILFNGQVNFNTELMFKKSHLNLLGHVNEKEVNVRVDKSWIDFEELGPILSTQIKGRGLVDGLIYGAITTPVFDLRLDQNEFQVIDFNLGNIRGDMKFYLDDLKMELSNINGNYKSIDYSAHGVLSFDSDVSNQMDLAVNIKKGTLEDARVALAPIINPLNKYLEKTSFNFKSSLHIAGKMNVEQMRTQGQISTSNILFYNEDLDSVEGDFTLDSNVIRWENIKAKKVSGRISGEAVYNLGTNEFTYRFSLSALRLKDILYYRMMSLGLDGEVYGEFSGVGVGENFSSRSHLRVTNSSIGNYKLKDSVLTVYNNNTDLFFSGTLLGRYSTIEGYLNLDNKNKDKLSSITAKLKTKEINILAGIISQHNLFNKNLYGEVEASLHAEFDIRNLESLDMSASLDKAGFHYSSIDFNLNEGPISIEIKNGKFKDWNYHLKGTGLDIESRGEGFIGKEFKLTHRFVIESSILELVNEKIENANGNLSGEHIIVGSSGNIKNYVNLKGNDVNVKLKDLPGLISRLKIDVGMDNEQVVVNSITGNYGNGLVKAKGLVRWKFPFPEVDLTANIEKARYPLFKKSGIVLSGDLSFRGKKLPYDLKGDLVIISGEIVEDTNDLASSAISDESYKRYIPVGYLEGNINFLKTDIRVISFDPIKIKNSMMGLGLLGNIRIFGTLSNPKFNGELTLSNSTDNKFLFKGRDFLLSDGVIHLVDGARKESPELRFSGSSKINQYDVYISVTGPVDSLAVEMTSNPPLVQSDILSLLTLGVTSSVSKNLAQGQRQSVTTLSIGSLVMDQLKINQSLGDSLGLRLSVQPQFVEDGTTLLKGKTDSASSNSRLKSGTVIKVQKRINKKVNLSVSSTVGGNINQTQGMNINYKFDNEWSLEGVYQLKSNDELEQQIPDSAGADVKYQWSF